MNRGSGAASEAARWAPWLVAAAASLALVAMLAASPARPLYDEAWFLSTVELLKRDGLSVAFIRDFPGAAGPTFAIVFAAVDAVAGLAFPWLRLVNVVLLLVTAVLITLTLPVRDRALIGATLVVLPTAGVAAGLALTEVPAAIFAVLSVTLLAQALRAQQPAAVLWCLSSGVALATAVLGRQNYLVLLPCLALAIRWRDGRPDQGDAWRVALVAAIAIAVVAPVFVIWGGLVPPRTAWSTSGIAPSNVVRGAGYAGTILLLLTPSIYTPLRTRVRLASILVAAIPIAIVIGNDLVPMRSAITALLGHRALAFAGWAAAYVLSCAALAFAAGFTLHLWQHRHDWLTRTTGAAVLLGLLSNARITHQFSSRYVFVVLPLLVIAAAPAFKITRATPLQMTSAAGISLAALASYYFAR